MIKFLTIGFTVATFLVHLASIEAAPPLSVDDVMSDVEQENTGVNRLSPQQRAAFEQWATSWTVRVIQQAPTFHPSQSLRSWINDWPEHMRPKKPSQEEAIKSRKEANQRVFRNINGTILMLRDGSEWKICDIDQPSVRWWQRGQQILISKAERDIVRPYILKNTGISDPGMAQAGATMVRPPNPTGQRPPDSAAYFRGSVILESIFNDGLKTTISTSDHKTWTIAPINQLLIPAIWRPHDRLKVESSSDAAYRWKITNLDSGDDTLASPGD